MIVNDLIGESMSMGIPCEINPRLTKALLECYDNFNKKVFDEHIVIDERLKDFVLVVYSAFGQNVGTIQFKQIESHSFKNYIEKEAVLGFSGGLDSAYHAIRLKELGYKVHLVHFANLNSYENNNSARCSIEFSRHNGFELTIVQIKKNSKNKMFWTENPIKNQLIQAFLVDFAIHNGIGTIALGDDYSMSFERPDFILGTNTTDCREIQERFERFVKQYDNNINFKMIERPIGSKSENKLERIKKLIEHDSLDLYYSCVGAGRFNQYNRKRECEKYSINLPKYNCGSFCAKCAMHNLLMYYDGIVTYPEEFIDKCWERLWKTEHGSIKALFGEDIDLEKRINNLYIY